MKFFLLTSISIIIIGCSTFEIETSGHNRSISSVSVENIDENSLFDYGKIYDVLIKFKNLDIFPVISGRIDTIDQEYEICNQDFSDESIVYNIFKNLISKFKATVSERFKLYRCEEKGSSFVAWFPNLSIYYEEQLVQKIIDKFGQEYGSRMINTVIAHELAHFIHEFSTIESVSGHEGLSVNNLVSENIIDRPKRCLDEDENHGSNKILGCIQELGELSHFEIDAYGAALLYANGYNDFEKPFVDFLNYHTELKLLNESDEKYIKRKKIRHRVRVRFFKQSVKGLKKYFN